MQRMWKRILWIMHKEDVHGMLQRHHSHASEVLRTDPTSSRKAAFDKGGVCGVQIKVRGVAHTKSVLLSDTNMFGIHTRTTSPGGSNKEERKAHRLWYRNTNLQIYRMSNLRNRYLP